MLCLSFMHLILEKCYTKGNLFFDTILIMTIKILNYRLQSYKYYMHMIIIMIADLFIDLGQKVI